MNILNSIINCMADPAAAQSTVSATSSATGNAPGPSCLEQSWYIWVIYGIVIVIFYFALIRPQKKQRQQEEQMRSNIEIGDEIITIGGICGRVVSKKEDDTLVIETGAERAKIKIKNWAISSRVNDRPVEEKPAEENEKKGLFSFLKK